MTKRAFAIAAHPDDIELFMAGTLLLLKDADYEIHYMNMTRGDCGTMEHDSETISRIRHQEAMDACAIAGAVYHESFLDDLKIYYMHDNVEHMAAVMREVAPEILLVHSLDDYMIDHSNAARLAATAAFIRPAPNFTTVPARDPVPDDVTIYHAQPHSNRDQMRRLVHPEVSAMPVTSSMILPAYWRSVVTLIQIR